MPIRASLERSLKLPGLFPMQAADAAEPVLVLQQLDARASDRRRHRRRLFLCLRACLALRRVFLLCFGRSSACLSPDRHLQALLQLLGPVPGAGSEAATYGLDLLLGDPGDSSGIQPANGPTGHNYGTSQIG